MQLLVNKLVCNYQKHGQGHRVMLCLHGWADSSKTFENLIKFFSNEWTVVALDLPGFGKSDKPKVPWSLKDYADFVAAFNEKAGIKPEVIVGHSNGGAIAIHGIAHGQLKCDKLVLLASSGVRSEGVTKRKVLKTLSKPAKGMLYLLPESRRTDIKRKTYKLIGSDYYAAEHMGETFKNIVAYDVKMDAKKIDMPALLIYGDKDSSTPISQAEVLKSLMTNSKLIILKNNGHFIHHENPGHVCSAIEEFINENS